MNVSLTPQLEKYVTDLVATGLYGSASEVVRQALRKMQLEDRIMLEQMRQDFVDAMQEAREGRARDGREVIAEIRAKLRAPRNAKGANGQGVRAKKRKKPS